MKILVSTRYIIGVLFVCLLFTACSKDEGPGGTSTIKGKVIVHDFDISFALPEPALIYPAVDEEVFIIYGSDGTTYNDNFKSSYDGSYEFKYLQKGTYKLFVYSKDSTGVKATGIFPTEKVPHFITVEIKDNGSTVDAPDLVILKNNQ